MSIFTGLFETLAVAALLVGALWMLPYGFEYVVNLRRRDVKSAKPRADRSRSRRAGDATPTSSSRREKRPPPNAPENVSWKYEVRLGDATLRLVAQKTLGNSRRWRELRELNRAVVNDPNLLIPGTVLTIPGQQSPRPRSAKAA